MADGFGSESKVKVKTFAEWENDGEYISSHLRASDGSSVFRIRQSPVPKTTNSKSFSLKPLPICLHFKIPGKNPHVNLRGNIKNINGGKK